MATTTKKSQLADDVQFVAGMQKDLQGLSSLMVAGQTLTVPQATQILKGRIDASNAVVTAKAAYATAVAAHTALLAQTKVVTGALRQQVTSMFVNQPDKLADFGITPKKVTPKTALTKVVAAEKNRATRKARGTMGSKAKLAVKGQIPETITLPTTPQVQGSSPVVSLGNGMAVSAASAAPQPSGSAVHPPSATPTLL